MADPLALDHAVMARHISDLQLQVADFKTSVESIPALLPRRSSRSASSTEDIAKQAAADDLRSDTVISLLASIPVIIDKTLAAIQTLSNSMHTLESNIQRSSNSGAQLASRLHALEARDAKLRPEMELFCRNILASNMPASSSRQAQAQPATVLLRPEGLKLADIPIYDGSPSLLVSDYKAALLAYAVSNGLQSVDDIQVVSLYKTLSGPALAHYQRLIRKATRTSQDLTVSTLLSEFNARFSLQDVTDARSMLDGLRWVEGTPLDSWIDQLEVVINIWLDSKYKETIPGVEEFFDIFLRGFNDEHISALARSKLPPLSSYPRSFTTTSVMADWYFTAVRSAADAVCINYPFMRTGASKSSRTPASPSQDSSPLATVVCAFCNKKGHSADKCRKKSHTPGATCSFCSRIGHLEQQCRKKARQQQPKVKPESDSDDDEETEEPPDQDSSSTTNVASRLASMESLFRSLGLHPSSSTSSTMTSSLSRPFFSN